MELKEINGFGVRNQTIIEVDGEFWLRIIGNVGGVFWLKLSREKPKQITSEEKRRLQAKLDHMEEEKKQREYQEKINREMAKEAERIKREGESKLQAFAKKLTGGK